MKRLLSLLTTAALVLSLVPAGALATGDTPEQEDTPVCVCTDKCTEGSVNSDCAVCTADPSACQSKEAAPVPQNQEEPKQNQSESGAPEAPVCTCTDKCAEGAVNSDCLVCAAVGADLTACKGPESQQGQPQQNENPPAEPEEPVCTCTAKCAEDAASGECPVCGAEGADLSACQGKEPEQPQVITITEWSWVVTADTPKLADGKLYLPSAITEANLAGITDTLPKNIEANGQSIPVSWTYDWNTQTFTATLPAGYALAESAAPLTLETVDMGADTLENDPVEYIDENNQQQTCTTYTLVTGNDNAWNDGWYVVKGDVTIGQRVTVSGDVKLILTDGCNLTVNGGIDVSAGNALTIYGQSVGTGSLEATATDLFDAGIGGSRVSCGTVIIYGGKVHATAGMYGAAIGGGHGGSGGNITIYGGTVDATAGMYGAGIGCGYTGAGGTIAINGGSIRATGGSNGAAGIGGSYANNGCDVTISGGTVTAIGGGSAPGIGGGSGASNHGTLTGNTGYVIHASISGDTSNFNGIVYSGSTYQVYGNVTLAENIVLNNGETLRVSSGATLTVADLSMISGSGTIDLPGDLMMEPAGPEDISAPEKIAYTDGNLTQAILDAVSISAEKEVTLAGQQVTAHLIADGWTKTLKEGTAVSAGTYTVQFTKGSNTIEKSITVAQSGSTLENQVSTDKPQYTYGDTITITGKPTATGVAAFSLTPPAENQMTVYSKDGKTQLSEAVNPDSKGIYTMTLDSTKLGAGTHTLVVKFTGNDNLAKASQEITVVINKADPNVSIPTGLTAVIGSTLKDVALPSGWTWKAPGTDVGNAGEYSFLAVFTPADIANYNTLEVSLTVSVSKPDLSSAKVTLGAALTYTGKDQAQTIASVILNGQALAEGTDYTVTNNTGKAAGTYTLTITGKGNYTGTLKVSFPIAKAPLTITGVDVQSKTYDGTTAATVTGVSFKGLVNGEALAMGVDYTATADFADASAGTGKSITSKVTLLSSTLGKNYTLNGGSFTTSGDISAAASKLSFKVDRTKPVKGQYITFSVTPQIKGDNRSFLQRVLGINAPKVEFWANGTTKLGEVKVEEGKTSTFAYDTDKGGLKLGKNTITAEFTGDGNLKGCTESVVVYLHDSTTSAPTGDESNIQTWTVVLVVSAVVLIGLGVGAVIYRKKKK